jgi:hypothetical protein
MGNSCITNKVGQENIKNNSEELKINLENHTILKWKSSIKTEKYHWWPMWETKINDRANNLYADGSGLHKYDELFGAQSVIYQKNHYRIPLFSNITDKKWAGFCNYASILSSLYEYPKKNVVVNHKMKVICFDTWEIEALMMCATNNAIKKNISIFFGERNNNNSITSIEEPSPCDLLHMLKVLCSYDKPFIMDIDNRNPVWNYAYDKVIVYKFEACHIDHVKPSEGQTVYYNFRICSAGYIEQSQNLWAYVNTIYDDHGNVAKQTEKWISKVHPDFLWCRFPIDKPWEGKCEINPEIDANIVYKIYIESLKDEPQLLVIP